MGRKRTFCRRVAMAAGRETDEQLTEYEKQRLSRIRENEARLEALGLRSLAASPLLRSPSPGTAKGKQKKRSADEDEEYVPSDSGGGEDEDESSSESAQDEEVDGEGKSSSRSRAKVRGFPFPQLYAIHSSSFLDGSSCLGVALIYGDFLLLMEGYDLVAATISQMWCCIIVLSFCFRERKRNCQNQVSLQRARLLRVVLLLLMWWMMRQPCSRYCDNHEYTTKAILSL